MKNILIADDDDIMRSIIANYLRQKGYYVHEAKDGQVAFELIKNHKNHEVEFDLLIADLVMPVISGFELIEKVRNLGLDIEIIAVSATDKMDDVIEVMKEGKAHGFLRKPLTNIEYVNTVVTKALEHRRLVRENKQLLEKLANLSTHDPLTGIYNRRKFDEQLDMEMQRVKRYGRPLSLLMLDVDHFKNYNDKNGHPKGDRVLRGVADLIQKQIRSNLDCAFRYGGEEFAILLPETSKIKALMVAERIRVTIFESYFEGQEMQPLGRVTISMGVASSPEDTDDPLELVQKADEALYKAKSEGRNCVCLYHYSKKVVKK